MDEVKVYVLQRLGYLKEKGDLVDIFLGLEPTPDFVPSIRRDGNLPPMYLAKRDKIVGKDGRFKKEDGNYLEYEDIGDKDKGIEVLGTMNVIRNFKTEKIAKK